MDDQPSHQKPQQWLTIPNAICLFRLIGSLGLIVLALSEQRVWFLIAFLILAFSDWIDGKIAIWFRQQSTVGPTLDSYADIAMYTGLLLGGLWLEGETLLVEWPWLVGLMVAFVINVSMGLWKFGRLPTYHTRLAKTSWFLLVLAVGALLLDWSIWWLRIALLAVIVTNLEEFGITLRLKEWKTNIPSIFHIRSSESSGTLR